MLPAATLPPSVPMTAQDRHNLLCFCIGEGLWGLQAAMVASGTVLTALLLQVGASQPMVGAITAIEMGAGVLPQLLGIWLFRTARTRKRRIIAWHFVAILPCIFGIGALALAQPWLPARSLPWLLLLCFGVFVATIGVVVSAWLDWLAGIFAEGIRGRATGWTWGLSALAGTAGALIAGWVLKHDPSVATFGYLFLVAGVLGCLSLATFYFVQDPQAGSSAADHTPEVRRLLARFGTSLRDANFRNYLIGRLLASAGFCIGPFVLVYFNSPAGGGLAVGTVVACAAGQTASSAICSVVFGKLGDRAGHRLGVLLGIGAQALVLVVLLAGQGVAVCVLVYVLLGGAGSAALISNTNMVLESCPHDHRLAHITAGNLVTAPALIVFPLLASAAVGAWSLTPVFAGSLGISVLALLWVLVMVREPRVIRLTTATITPD